MPTATAPAGLTVKPELLSSKEPDRADKKAYWCGVRPGVMPNGELIPYPPYQNENFGGADFPLFSQQHEETEEVEPGYGTVFRLGSKKRGKICWLTDDEKRSVMEHVAKTVYRVTKKIEVPLDPEDKPKVFFTAVRFAAGDPKMGTDSQCDVPAARFCFMVPHEKLLAGFDAMDAEWPESMEYKGEPEAPKGKPAKTDKTETVAA